MTVFLRIALPEYGPFTQGMTLRMQKYQKKGSVHVFGGSLESP